MAGFSTLPISILLTAVGGGELFTGDGNYCPFLDNFEGPLCQVEPSQGLFKVKEEK